MILKATNFYKEISKKIRYRSKHNFTFKISIFWFQTFEKVLVQNIYLDLNPLLKNCMTNMSRWNLVKISFPYVLHAAASLLHNK